MKKRIICLALCAAMLVSLLGCGKINIPVPTHAPTTEATAAASPAQARYEKALEALLKREDVSFTVTAVTTRNVAGTEFTETLSRNTTYNKLGSEKMIAQIDDTLSLWDEKIESTLIFSGETCFVTTDDCDFWAGISQADFLDLQYPLDLIDASLYEEISEEGDIIRFAGATAPEGWLDDGNVTLQSAEAEVTLSKGRVSDVTYTAQYLQGAIPCRVEVSMHVLNASRTLDAMKLMPKTTDGIPQVDYPILPALYQEACINLFAFDTLRYSLADNVFLEAAGAQFISTNDANIYGRDGFSMSSRMEDVIYTYDGTYEYITDDSYIDGIYTYTQTSDGEETGDSYATDAADIREDTLYIMQNPFAALYELSDLYFDYVNGYYMIYFDGNEDFADYLQRYACYTYLGDENGLSDYADSFQTDAVGGYLSIDPCTLLPAAYNAYLEGSCSIEGDDYTISTDSTLSFGYDPLTIYHEIFNEMPEESAPETDPTPVFYKVTDTEGHTLWLLGTIHVGDVRTDHLPAAIYDAFDSADALAVEFDGDAFYDLVDEDPELQSMLSEAYYYNDGTTLADHLDEETYEAAVASMRATGTYGLYSEYLKPWVLESMISNAMLDTGYTLNSLHGVDEMLMRRARLQGKEIRDVESGEFQIRMFADTSDEMQQFILEGTLWSDKIETVLGTLELYELWCSGDEAALIENLNEEPDFSEATEEEIALYKEYNDILLISRNHGMHDVAISYLESGDTVFYAVGLAHLLGEDGLVGSLRDAGYTVELVTY